MRLAGGCYCGAVRYQIDAEPFDSTLCHCADCRRVAGAPAVAWFSVRPGEIGLTGIEPARFTSSPGATRSFCPRCGTPLLFQNDPGVLDVSTCTLDQPELVPPADHTRTGGQVAWLHLADALPRYPGTRTGGVAPGGG